jgi:2-polyprenyl-3-methyl-5-hydroxy-6-metoxy-1,4-benzoquinol methylase
MPAESLPHAASAAPAPAPYVAMREDPYKAHSLVVGYCGANQRVLEVGCSTGYLSEALQRRGCRITGVEIDATAGEAARQWCERVVIGDVESMDLAPLGSGYDVLLLADVLEHLRDPVAALRRLRPLLAPNGYAVISVPNVANWAMRLGLLAGRWNYTERGILDRTHLRFFTRKTIQSTLADGGFDIRTFDLSAPLPLNPPAAISGLAHAIGRLRPSFFAYQFVIVAVPAR